MRPGVSSSGGIDAPHTAVLRTTAPSSGTEPAAPEAGVCPPWGFDDPNTVGHSSQTATAGASLRAFSVAVTRSESCV